ncbi:hypothetical protein BGZ67_008786, partial [Mortierella alpina]
MRQWKSEPDAETRPMNPFATVDQQNPAIVHQHRPKFSPKVRFEPSKEQPAPATSLQHKLKPWTDPPEKPNVRKPTKKPPAAYKTDISEIDRFQCRRMRNALLCQVLMKSLQYLEDLGYPPSTPGAPRPAVPVTEISQQGQAILDNLCLRLSSMKMTDIN